MPAMPRIKGKAEKIAFAILGVPGAYKDKKSAAQRRVDKQLLAQETSRVR